MKKKITLILCLFVGILFSQEKEKKQRRHALAVGAGTGINIDYSYKLNKSFALTAKYGFLNHKEEDYDYEIDGETLLADASFDFTHMDLLLSIGGSFRLVVGAGYFTNNQVDLALNFTEEVIIGDVTFTPDQVGSININADWGEGAILPYLGLSFGRAVPKKGLGFGLEIGTYYVSDGPTMSLNATGLIEDTKNQQELLQESFKENKFLPNLSLRLAFAF